MTTKFEVTLCSSFSRHDDLNLKSHEALDDGSAYPSDLRICGQSLVFRSSAGNISFLSPFKTNQNQMQIKRKTILITGSTSGIGYNLAKTLAVDHNVIIASRPAVRVESTVKELNEVVYAAAGYTLNLSSLADVNTTCQVY
jgi:short chain dehydrogenase